jgi:hypothetical protein
MAFLPKKGRFINSKLVYTTNLPMDAEHYKANLEGADIPVQILSQFDTSRMITIGDFAIVKIFVPEEYYEDALQIIEDINREQNDNDEQE